MRGLNSTLNTGLLERLSNCGIDGLRAEIEQGIVVIRTYAPRLLDLMEFLKNDKDCGFNVLTDLTAVDYLDKKAAVDRFEIIYLLWSTSTMQRVRIKVTAPEGSKVPSVTGLWKGANWPEREVFDLFGIEFGDHPVMERILMPENFRGHPLRKDFPLEGIGEDYLIESILIDSQRHEPGSENGGGSLG